MIIEAAEAEMNYGSNPQMRLQIRRKDVNSMLYLDKPNAEKVIGDVTGKIREMEELALIKSMTGYGRAVETFDGREITAEIRSVNNRYLDCSIKLPRRFLKW